MFNSIDTFYDFLVEGGTLILTFVQKLTIQPLNVSGLVSKFDLTKVQTNFRCVDTTLRVRVQR